jgi:hypothetical protein
MDLNDELSHPKGSRFPTDDRHSFSSIASVASADRTERGKTRAHHPRRNWLKLQDADISEFKYDVTECQETFHKIVK